MKPEERDALLQELLEYHYDCHDEPERIEKLLGENAEARALLEEARATAATLDQAARLPIDRLELKMPSSPTKVPGRPFRSFIRVAAGLALLINGMAIGHAVWRNHDLAELRDDSLRLVVSGPPAMPDAVTSAYRVETYSGGGDAVPATLDWRVLDAADHEIASGERESDGALTIALDPRLEGARALLVRAQHGSAREETRIPLAPGVGSPLVHLDLDKPIYRPGERMFIRGIALNRVSLQPVDRDLLLHIVNPKGNRVASFHQRGQQGVVACEWQLPEDAAGGRYRLEARSQSDDCAIATCEFTLRRFERPMLRKKIVLDRASYAAGAAGQAEVLVERLAGGPAEGAIIEAALVIDGVTSSVGKLAADAEGRAIFAFSVPQEVAIGDARFVARIADGQHVETEVKPFLVPTGAYSLQFHPEGGDLLVGATNRVYFETVDSMNRPVAATGRVLDDEDREVAVVTSKHQGRGVFTIKPEAGRSYRLVTADEKTFVLPEAKPGALLLDTSEFSAAAGGALRSRIVVPGAGPWVVGLFCRGFLVESRTFQGAGEHRIQFDDRPELAGVLRLTVFDRNLEPRAERLVHRHSARKIEVTMSAENSSPFPGQKQELRLLARDEEGRPVKAVLGLTVSDQAVRDQSGEHHVGLADVTFLGCDVEKLEDIETFLVGPEAEEHIDLLLGTRGWRRFAWRRVEQFVETEGDRARSLLAREGRADIPRIEEARSYDPGELVLARRRDDEAEETSTTTLMLSILLLGMIGLGRLGWNWSARAQDSTGFARVVTATLLPLGLSLLVIGGFLATMNGIDGSADLAAEKAFARRMPLEVAGLDEVRPETATRAAPEDAALEELGDIVEEDLELDDHILLGRGIVLDDVDADEIALGDAPVADRALIGLIEVQGEVEAAEMFQDDIRPFGRGRAPAQLSSFRIYAHQYRPATEGREDFSETVYWNAMLETDDKGEARVAFDLSDLVTTWTARVDAHGEGRVGQGELRFDATLPLSVSITAPVEASSGDRYLLPINVDCRLPGIGKARVEVTEVRGGLRLVADRAFDVNLVDGRGRALVPVEILDGADSTSIKVTAEAGGAIDHLTRSLRIVSRGFPHHLGRSGLLEGEAELVFATPLDCLADSLRADLVLYPSALAMLQQGLESMLREPYGCFEQTSSVNYPNVMALRLMEATRTGKPAVVAKARDLVSRGYAKLVSFECSRRGYEWFGGDPGHEALSAYGLLEFHDMQPYVEVDPAMMARTRSWLLDRRDKKGGYLRNERALDSFGAAPKNTTDSYVSYALALTGTDPKLIARELDRLAERGQESDDAYEVALAAGALQAAGRLLEADGAREHLKSMQQADGGFVGKATITRSGKTDCAVETTAFAVLAFLDDPEDSAQALNGLRYILGHGDGEGCFGATQATVMALRALSAFAEREHEGEPASGSQVRVVLNGEEIARKTIDDHAARPLIISGLADRLRPGENILRLEGPDGLKLPWALDLAYFAEKPADDANCALDLRLSMNESRVREGETTSIRVRVTNLRGEGLPMTMVALGLPGNLEVPTAVLEDLKKAGRFDFWEIRGRDLFFYWRDMAPETTEDFIIDCVAKTPGLARGAASRAWLYYSPQETKWQRPLEVEVTVD